MNADKVREIFIELVANVPADQWEARLPELAGKNADVCRRVQQLLAREGQRLPLGRYSARLSWHLWH